MGSLIDPSFFRTKDGESSDARLTSLIGQITISKRTIQENESNSDKSNWTRG